MLITEAHNVIQVELGPREQLLWAGVPRKGFVLRNLNRTYYGVTNERIILLAKGLRGQQLTSIDLRRCPEISLDQQNDGSGTITFGLIAPTIGNEQEQPSTKIVHRSFRLSPPPLPKAKVGDSDCEHPDPAFEMIPDAKNVYNLIREARLIKTLLTLLIGGLLSTRNHRTFEIGSKFADA